MALNVPGCVHQTENTIQNISNAEQESAGPDHVAVESLFNHAPIILEAVEPPL